MPVLLVFAINEMVIFAGINRICEKMPSSTVHMRLLWNSFFVLLLVTGTLVLAETNNIEELFLTAEIVPDILDRSPKETLWVTYGTTTPVYPGSQLTPGQTNQQPHWIQWVGKIDALYTLAFIGPDSLTRQNSIHRSVPHWMRINIQGDGKGQGEEIVQYFGPMPPMGTGIRRYIFLVHEQLGGRLNVTLVNEGPLPYIINLQWKKIVQDNNLSTAPVAGNFFYSQNQDN